MSGPSWTERLFGGFRKTSERLSENLAAAVGTARLDDATLDDVEDALILSDLGPSAAGRIRERLKAKRFGLAIGEQELKEAVAEEIAAILRPVARPLEIVAFPRPQVILTIGVNGSGKTTTIAKLAHLFQEQDYGVMLAAGDTFRAAAIGQLAVWAERRRHTNDDRVGIGQPVEVGGRLVAAGLHRFLDPLLADVLDVALAPGDRGDLGRIDVEAGDEEPCLAEDQTEG